MKFRKHVDHHFTIVQNEVLEDVNLSWKAKGIFVYLWSKSDDWVYYQREVTQHATDGISSLQAGLYELEKAGYLKVTRTREKGQFKDSQWDLYPVPTGFRPKSDFPIQDKPIYENRTLPSTDYTKDLSNTSTGGSKDETMSQHPLAYYQQAYNQPANGVLSPELQNWANKLGNQVTNYAIWLAAGTGASFNYARSILENWEKAGVTSIAEAQKERQSHQDKNNKGKGQGNIPEPQAFESEDITPKREQVILDAWDESHDVSQVISDVAAGYDVTFTAEEVEQIVGKRA